LFNAIPYLGYWDVVKNYYSNKQEEYGVMIHNTMDAEAPDVDFAYLNDDINLLLDSGGAAGLSVLLTQLDIVCLDDVQPDPRTFKLSIKADPSNYNVPINDIFYTFTWNETNHVLTCKDVKEPYMSDVYTYDAYVNSPVSSPNMEKPYLEKFELKNIDDMRMQILAYNEATPFIIDDSTIAPYGTPLIKGDFDEYAYPIRSTQEALAIKTYQSDLFNNWISTEWIDGENGINSITAIDTSSGSFNIDTLQLSRKVYDMLNRIAISGGSYDDWLDATYSHERTRSTENPIYLGGLSKELAFQEVVSNAAATSENVEQPLGTLAGRGVLGKKHKGGHIKVRCDEPCYIMGIISLTPRLDYSQGNKWDVNLETMNDFHKPGLDQIGFQDLITDQMAWFDTTISTLGPKVFKSAGKQPAWLNYMTNVNQVRGNFADETQQMFMTLNRKYEFSEQGIEDLTTYVDPSKFNHIFADTRLDAQNFWTQIAVNIFARRKMSAKVIPNL